MRVLLDRKVPGEPGVRAVLPQHCLLGGRGEQPVPRNTHFWVDRTAGVCASIYSNFLPFVTPEAFTMYNAFELALYASL